MKFTKSIHIDITKTGATAGVPAGGTTLALTSNTANLLNLGFCSTTCTGGTYSAGEVIGYSGGTIHFK